MGITTASGSMTSAEIAALSREHTFFSWSVQGAVDPIAVDHAEGIYLYTPEGQRIIDFNSQLMSVNIGHGDRRVIDAITAQATKLQFVQPAFTTEIRARLGAEAGRDPARRHGQGVLHPRRRGGRRERDQAGPPRDRPPQDPGPLPLVPRRHDGRHDPDRRPAPLGERARPRRRRPLSRTRTAGARPNRDPWPRACRASRTSSATRAPKSIAAIFLETIVGTNGILIPPDGYIAGRARDLRSQRHPDGRRRGHGRLRADGSLVRRRPLGRDART